MTIEHLLVLLLVGALAGLIGERLVGRGMPYGVVGAIVAGLVGAWLMVDVLHAVIAPEVALGGIPIISAILNKHLATSGSVAAKPTSGVVMVDSFPAKDPGDQVTTHPDWRKRTFP